MPYNGSWTMKGFFFLLPALFLFFQSFPSRYVQGCPSSEIKSDSCDAIKYIGLAMGAYFDSSEDYCKPDFLFEGSTSEVIRYLVNGYDADYTEFSYSLVGNEKHCAVTFSGVNSIPELAQTLIDGLFSTCYIDIGSRSCLAHCYMLDEYNSLVKDRTVDGKTLWENVENQNCDLLTVAGHSMGGALAELFAAEVKLTRPDQEVILVTYGSPGIFMEFLFPNECIEDFWGAELLDQNHNIKYVVGDLDYGTDILDPFYKLGDVFSPLIPDRGNMKFLCKEVRTSTIFYGSDGGCGGRPSLITTSVLNYELHDLWISYYDRLLELEGDCPSPE